MKTEKQKNKTAEHQPPNNMPNPITRCKPSALMAHLSAKRLDGCQQFNSTNLLQPEQMEKLPKKSSTSVSSTASS